MKLKQFYFITAMTAFTSIASLSLSSCSDDSYAPVTIVSVTDNNIFHSENVITINAFSNGLEFKIKGGSGVYVIHNNSSEIIDFRYDGSTLRIMPVSIGKGSLVISDNAGNSSIINVEVKNKANTFNVTSIEADAYGLDLTMRQIENIKDDIMDNTFVQSGGKFVFTYTEQNQNEGSVSLYPNSSNNSLSGIFSQETRYSDTDGKPYQEFNITMANGSKHTLMLKEERISSDSTAISFIENVTTDYKYDYPALEKAELIINLQAQVSE